MNDGPSARVLAALAAGGVGARFVGGCVRNAVLGRAVDDIDLAVDRPPETVMRALAAASIKTIPTGIKHGTVTALAERRVFELTTLRRDVETDGRRAIVAYTDDWLEDAARRDFTFNALYADPDGTLYDPFDGRADLAAGRVRFIGDADTRIAEDRLRVLRFFRFHAWYGKDGPQNYSFWDNKEFQTLTAQIDREVDPAKRVPLVRQAEAIMEQDPPLAPVAWERINEIWYNYVKGLNPAAYFGIFDVVRLDTVWLDKG